MSQTIIFVPGHMCDERLFSHQIEYFKNKFEIMVADLTKHESIHQSALDILKVAPKSFILVGLSMGGIVSMEIVRLAQERVSHLVLIDTNPYAEKPHAKTTRKANVKRVKECEVLRAIQTEFISKYFVHKPKEVKLKELCLEMALRLGPDVFIRQSKALINRVSQIKTLKLLECSTLIICGREDQICPLSYHIKMENLIKCSELVVFEKTGHLPTIESPKLTNSYIEDFIN